MKMIIIAFALIAFVGADVSHLSGNYLPPQEAAPLAPAPLPVGPAPSQEYIPPQQEEEIAPAPAPAPIGPAPIGPAPGPVEIGGPGPGPAGGDEGTEVGADGYRYKTVKRIRYRYRV